jgi:hypothetical protein
MNYYEEYKSLSLDEKYRKLFPYSYSNSYSKSLKFVRNEFFTLDQLGFERFLYLYERKYGVGPTQYVKKIYSSWRTGMTKMVRKTEERILICVPPILSREKQFKLLSIQIPEIIRQQKKEFRDLDVCTSNLNKVYSDIAISIVKRQYNLDWFVKEVFPPEELEEFLNVLKYTMLDCLKQSYQNVCKDILQLNNYIPKTNGAVRISYNISLLNHSVKFDIFPLSKIPDLELPMVEPLFVTKFRDYYRKILLNHAINQYKEETVGQVNSHIAISDINKIAEQIERIGKGQEYDTNLVIRGYGGNIHLHLQKKNLGRLQYEITKEYFKLFCSICLIFVLGILIIGNEMWFLIYFGGIFLFAFVGPIWEKINKLKAEVREYERKRRTRFKEA